MARRIVMTGSLLGAAGLLVLVLTGCSLNRTTTSTTQAEVTAVPTSAALKTAGKLTEIPAVEITSGPELADSTEAPVSDVYANLRTIGTQSDADTVYRIRLVNASGKDISGIYVRTDDMASYPKADYVSEADPLKDGETVVFFYDSADAVRLGEKTGQTPVYRMLLSFGEDTGVLHDFPFGKTDEVTIHYDTEYGVFYLTYTPGSGTSSLAGSADSVAEINTKSSEIQILRDQMSDGTSSGSSSEKSTASTAASTGGYAPAQSDGTDSASSDDGTDEDSNAVTIYPDTDEDTDDTAGEGGDEEDTAAQDGGSSSSDGGDVVG